MAGVSLQDFHQRYLQRERVRNPFEQLRDAIYAAIEYVYHGQMNGRHETLIYIVDITPVMKRYIEDLFIGFRFQWGEQENFRDLDEFRVTILWGDG